MKNRFSKPFGLLLASAVIFGSIFSGCKSKEVTSVKDEVLVEVFCSGPEYRSDKSTFRANATGESTDMEIARKKASSNSKAALAAQIETTIKGVTDNYVNSREFNNVEEVEERFEALNREVVNQQLNNVKTICEKITKTKTGTYKCYMAIEMGAKAGLIEPDKKTYDWLKAHKVKGQPRTTSFARLRGMGSRVKNDKDAVYSEVLEFDVSKIVPQVAMSISTRNEHIFPEL